MEADIYFMPEWQQLYAQRENQKWDSVTFECQEGAVEYGFCRRSIEINGEKFPYEDIVTPYAFCGPKLNPRQNSPECIQSLAKQFDDFFQKYCEEQGIVAEFVQFNPWLKNQEPFRDLYTLDYRSHIIAIDLTKNDLMAEELNARRRRAVRSALKQGVEIRYDDTGEMIDEFLRLYRFTVEKYDATDYYQFDYEFLHRLFEKLPGKISFAYAMYQGKCVSICALLHAGKYVHYYLAGNDPEESRANGSSLLIYDVACKAKEKGYELFVLGGAEGAMMEFKQTFTTSGYFDYYSGKRIRNQHVYDMLVEKNGIRKTNYFPAYRDNGAIQFMDWLKESEEKE